jgi:hypothetical protein
MTFANTCLYFYPILILMGKTSALESATTFRITTFSLMTVGIATLKMAEHFNAEGCVSFIAMLNVVMLSVIMLSVVAPPRVSRYEGVYGPSLCLEIVARDKRSSLFLP